MTVVKKLYKRLTSTSVLWYNCRSKMRCLLCKSEDIETEEDDTQIECLCKDCGCHWLYILAGEPSIIYNPRKENGLELDQYLTD